MDSNVDFGTGPTQIKNIKCVLQDDYPCSFEEYFGLIELVVPNMFDKQNLEKYYNNPNIVVMIIEKMSLGILMSRHIAERFSYIQNAIKYNDYQYIYKTGMIIVTIPREWDTKKWLYTKIRRFYDNLEFIECKDCNQLRAIEKIRQYPDYICSSIDLEFLESLLWNAHLELD